MIVPFGGGCSTASWHAAPKRCSNRFGDWARRTEIGLGDSDTTMAFGAVVTAAVCNEGSSR